jgi:hypothetical protein
MRLSLYSIGQYTDTKKYYIMRLSEVSDYGSITHKIILDSIDTKKNANALLKYANSLGNTRPYDTVKLDLIRFHAELTQNWTPLTPFFVNVPNQGGLK